MQIEITSNHPGATREKPACLVDRNPVESPEDLRAALDSRPPGSGPIDFRLEPGLSTPDELWPVIIAAITA